MRCLAGLSALLLLRSTAMSSTTRQHCDPTSGTFNKDGSCRVIWNFNEASDLSSWHESSDGTARSVGMSTGAFKLQRTEMFTRAVMFSLLNPQPNGAGFVGFFTNCHDLDLSKYRSIRMRYRAQGQNFHYKFYLKDDKNSVVGGSGSYESHFLLEQGKFSEISVPLDSFVFYYRGRRNETAPPPNLKAVTLFGIQVYGGVYDDFKQSGVSSLEVDWIAVE